MMTLMFLEGPIRAEGSVGWQSPGRGAREGHVSKTKTSERRSAHQAQGADSLFFSTRAGVPGQEQKALRQTVLSQTGSSWDLPGTCHMALGDNRLGQEGGRAA